MTLTALPAVETPPPPVVPTVVPVQLKGGVIGRRVEVWQAYQDYRKTCTTVCGFCSATVNEVVEVCGTMAVIVNRWPYAAWDGMHVVDHLMVIPARHLLGKQEFTEQEATDWWKVAAEYESRGYSVYTRSPDNASRSMAHLHTHLIRTQGWFKG